MAAACLTRLEPASMQQVVDMDVAVQLDLNAAVSKATAKTGSGCSVSVVLGLASCLNQCFKHAFEVSENSEMK